MPHIKKILVVGASIAGPAVCYWLKQYGLEPTLIERHSQTRQGGYAIDIRGIAVELSKKMGIYEDVVAMRTQLQFGDYVDSDGTLLHQEKGERTGFRKEDEVEIVRGDLVNILMQRIPDVPCHFSQSIDTIHQDDTQVMVTFKDGKTENYDLLIGADGLHSSTRAKVFSSDEYSLYDLGCYISVFLIPNYLNLNHKEIIFEKDQKIVQINSDRDPKTAYAGFLCRSTHKLKDIRDESAQKQFLIDTFSDLGWETNKLLELMKETPEIYFDAIAQVKMESYTKGRVALLGDAGYCASPLSGQGTSLALVGAYILAGELNKAKGDYHIAFKQYNTLMRPFVEANQAFGEWSSQTFLPDETGRTSAEKRIDNLMEKLEKAANAITLPVY